jgi:predicted RNA-binding Zn-ribbon protein involved in translation (DUF1610 family)
MSDEDDALPEMECDDCGYEGAKFVLNMSDPSDKRCPDCGASL